MFWGRPGLLSRARAGVNDHRIDTYVTLAGTTNWVESMDYR
jgi:hypothetical protein